VQRVNRSHKTVSSCLVRSSDPSGKAWTHLYKLNDCNCMVEYFYTCLYDLLNVYLPVRERKIHCTDEPWITDRFRHLIKQRQFAWKQGK